MLIGGHIHQPRIGKITTSKGTVDHLNSGDWIENLSALEYNEGRWALYMHETVAEHMPSTRMASERPVLA